VNNSDLIKAIQKMVAIVAIGTTRSGRARSSRGGLGLLPLVSDSPDCYLRGEKSGRFKSFCCIFVARNGRDSRKALKIRAV
jgi:hypothetical protein